MAKPAWTKPAIWTDGTPSSPTPAINAANLNAHDGVNSTYNDAWNTYIDKAGAGTGLEGAYIADATLTSALCSATGGIITDLQMDRQGGSGTDWTTAGSTNYTVSNPKIQFGCVECTIATGTERESSDIITFPTAFTNAPIIFCTIDGSGDFNTLDETPHLLIAVGYPTATQVQFRAITRSGTVSADRTFKIHWQAIGV